MASRDPPKDLTAILKSVNEQVKLTFGLYGDEKKDVTCASIEKKLKTKKELALLAFDLFSELVDAQLALAQMKKQDMAKEQQLKDYKLKCEKLESNQASLQTEISSLKKKKMNTPDNVDGPGLQQLMRKELETFQTNLVEDLNTKMNHTKNLTEKKWSDLFKSNKDDLKDQKKQANMERKTLEKTIADNKRQTLVDNLERQKRASNICVSNVAESTKTDKNAKDKDDRDTIIDILQMKASDVKHVFRAGAVQDKPRPLIIVLASPELARTKHDYGKGRPIRVKEGRNILYWINPDLIKADRHANYKARLAKPKKAENDKIVKTENDKVVKTENDQEKIRHYPHMSQEEEDDFIRRQELFLANCAKGTQ